MNDQRELQQLRNLVASLASQVARLGGEVSQISGPRPRVYIAKEADGNWVEQAVNGGELVDFTDGRTAATDGDFALIEPEEAFGVIEFDDVVDGNRVKRGVKFSTPGSSGSVLVVKLVTDGGDGSVATPFTYTAKSEDDVTTYGTTLSPSYRPLVGRVPSPAVLGLGDTTGGSFRLLEAYETFGKAPCQVVPTK